MKPLIGVSIGVGLVIIFWLLSWLGNYDYSAKYPSILYLIFAFSWLILRLYKHKRGRE